MVPSIRSVRVKRTGRSQRGRRFELPEARNGHPNKTAPGAPETRGRRAIPSGAAETAGG